MRKVNLAVCALALSVASATAFAGTDGTVTFNGKLINETCEVAAGSENIVVTLPTLSTQNLSAAGEEAGSTSFVIDVVNCPTEITSVAAHFEAINSTGANPVTGNLTNNAESATAAGKVEVRLYNISDASQILVGDTGSKFDVIPGADVDAPGTVRMSYAGGYYATAATTAGDVTAQVQYVLAYN
ncbi:fimbrial protein [Yersinia pekkanenii]|uniref:Frimbrial protein n=1 Tax=Yersinia pekkanenii TaxID=1288385 RepID=A0A0T9Q7N7_9GAMM|nr:fimbrial protein [Yersinia pekkanenii]CNH99357.1 frimbrial protein [Yersinia pekkanenii]CRY65057.1 frimbrial protein [Yersinia pekkanenii]